MSDPNNNRPLKLSIVVPAYNGTDTIAECLDAILNQDGYSHHEDYEVIVVDDGSSDDTASIASKYPVRLIQHKANLGRMAARLTGATAARSELLLFVDVRVMLAPDVMSVYFKQPFACAYIGDLGEAEQAEESSVDRLFLRLRSLYYYPHYPQQVDYIILDKNNFYKVPKGAGCLFLPKQTFLDATPTEFGKFDNDDTKVFENIVFQQNHELARCKQIRATYYQRRSLSQVLLWFQGRGRIFSTFLLGKKPLYIVLYIIGWLLMIIAAGLLLSNLNMGLLLLTAIAGVLVFGTALLVTKPTDLLIFPLLIGLLALSFWWGITMGLFSRATGRETVA